MTFLTFFFLILSGFAVFGFLFLIALFFDTCPKAEEKIFVIKGDGLTDEEIIIRIQSARMYLLIHAEYQSAPVVLFDEKAPREVGMLLAEKGIAFYEKNAQS